MRTCIAEGGILACGVVWTEVATGFADRDAVVRLLDSLGVAFSPLDRDAALAAAGAFRSYRLAGGGRKRVAADFLIGAHASVQAERLLTRDRGFFSTYFDSLVIVDPSL